MANLIFRGPRTGMNVQHWLADEPVDNSRSSYETVVCQACSRLHFIERQIIGRRRTKLIRATGPPRSPAGSAHSLLCCLVAA